MYPYALLHGPPLLALGDFLRDDVSWVAAGIQPSIKNQTTKTKKNKSSKPKQTPKLYPQTPDQPPQRPDIITIFTIGDTPIRSDEQPANGRPTAGQLPANGRPLALGRPLGRPFLTKPNPTPFQPLAITYPWQYHTLWELPSFTR